MSRRGPSPLTGPAEALGEQAGVPSLLLPGSFPCKAFTRSRRPSLAASDESFDRSAASARQAVVSALDDVRKAVPEARLIEAEPDLVGVSDIADAFSFSRQNMRKLVQSHPESFPLPLHEGRSSLWHLAEVLDWFEARQQRTVDPMLREVAWASLAVNVARESARVHGRDEADGSARRELG